MGLSVNDLHEVYEENVGAVATTHWAQADGDGPWVDAARVEEGCLTQSVHDHNARRVQREGALIRRHAQRCVEALDNIGNLKELPVMPRVHGREFGHLLRSDIVRLRGLAEKDAAVLFEGHELCHNFPQRLSERSDYLCRRRGVEHKGEGNDKLVPGVVVGVDLAANVQNVRSSGRLQVVRSITL